MVPWVQKVWEKQKAAKEKHHVSYSVLSSANTPLLLPYKPGQI